MTASPIAVYALFSDGRSARGCLRAARSDRLCFPRWCSWVCAAGLTMSALWVAGCPEQPVRFFTFIATAAAGTVTGRGGCAGGTLPTRTRRCPQG